MVCKNCGQTIIDASDNCIKCGSNPSKNTKAKFLAIAVTISILIVLVLVVITSLMFQTPGYISVLDTYFKAYEQNDPRLLRTVYAEFFLDSVAADFVLSEQVMEERARDWGCFKDHEISFEVLGERRATERQLIELRENIYDWHVDYEDREKYLITDAYVLDVKIYSSGNTNIFNDGILVIKENGKWCVTYGSISCSFFDNQ